MPHIERNVLTQRRQTLVQRFLSVQDHILGVADTEHFFMEAIIMSHTPSEGA